MGREENSSSAESEPELWASVRSSAQLGGFLKVARERRNLSQEALAELIGVDRRYVYQVESGEPTLYARRLFALLRELGVSMEVRLATEPDGGSTR